ncbi:MAG: hypothetical protein GX442_23480 [Candidatus Riflebacteria bacterium]|nr:hypothetical protein [Candidatus Riflebacteria bacterium]
MPPSRVGAGRRPAWQIFALGLLLAVAGQGPVMGQYSSAQGAIQTLLGGPPDSLSPSSTGPEGVGAPASASGTRGIVGPGLASDAVQYDPAMDNRLTSPATPQGLFGRPILEVERTLRAYGARPYSYAFGKYSRLTFSVYLITLLFDRERKLGGVVVSPKPPFTQVEPKVQQYLMKVFLPQADLTGFQTILGRTRMEIWFQENQKSAKSVLETLDNKDRFLR